MNATENHRIRAALDRGVGALPPRTMPVGTRARIRRRQARWVACLAFALSVATFAGARVLSAGSTGGTPADGGNFSPDNPLEVVPAGWPAVEIGDPSRGYRIAPGVAGGHEIEVIASGTVDGYGFSFQSFVGDGPDSGSTGPCLGFAGPGSEDIASGGTWPTGEAPVDSATCAGVQGVPLRTDLYLAGQQDPVQAPGIAANYGFLSPRVGRLDVVLDSGTTLRIPVLASPPGWHGLGAFLFFPPEGATGSLVAYAGDGTRLAEAPLCRVTGIAGGCGGVVTQLAPIPGARGRE